jgi:hypothetical protein
MFSSAAAKRVAIAGILSVATGAYVLMADSLCNDTQKAYCRGGCNSVGYGDSTGCYIDNNNGMWCYCTDPVGPFGPLPPG